MVDEALTTVRLLLPPPLPAAAVVTPPRLGKPPVGDKPGNDVVPETLPLP